MKSFFALAAAFALAIVPLTIAQTVTTFDNVRFDSAILGGTIGVSPPPGSTALHLATPGDGNLTTFFIPNEPASDLIAIFLKGYVPDDVLCISGTPASNGSIATVEDCGANNPQHLWTINPGGSGTIANEAGLCLSIVPGGSGEVLSIPCDDPPTVGQIWDAVTSPSD